MKNYYWFEYDWNPECEILVDCDIRNIDVVPSTFYFRSQWLKNGLWENNKLATRAWFGFKGNMTNRTGARLHKVLTEDQAKEQLFIDCI